MTFNTAQGQVPASCFHPRREKERGTEEGAKPSGPKPPKWKNDPGLISVPASHVPSGVHLAGRCELAGESPGAHYRELTWKSLEQVLKSLRLHVNNVNSLHIYLMVELLRDTHCLPLVACLVAVGLPVTIWWKD